MKIKDKAIWLKGFLESLTYGDNISKKQVSILLSKMEELVSELEQYEENGEDNEDEDDEGNDDNYNDSIYYNRYLSDIVNQQAVDEAPVTADDDLPF